MKSVRIILIFSLVFCVFGLSGCSPRGPKTEAIQGTITCKGKPVEGGIVALTPIDDPKGLPAFGRTNDKGQYTITSLRGGRDGAGAQIGNYRVTVTKEVPSREMTAAEKRAYDEVGTMPNIEPKNILPPRYASSEQSGLEIQVNKGKNVFDFDLTD